MKNRFFFTIFLLIPSLLFAQPSGKGVVSVVEEDSSPEIYPWQIKFPNGSLTDNSDGTASISLSGSYAPNSVDFLVGTASGDLTAEIVVGTAPGGSLGGTWASPTIDDLFLLNTGDIGSGTYNFTGNVSTLGNVGIGNTNPLVLLDTTTSPSAGLKVLASGRVGIGTTVPAYTLDVTGDIRATGDIYSTDQYTVTGDMGALGNLGVGTTTPILKVDVRGAGTSIFGFVGGSMGIGNTAPQGLLDVSSTTPGTGLIVLSTGRVGIGLTNPSVALDVSGSIKASGTGTFNILSITNPIDISSQTNLSGDTENVLTGDALSIGAAITRDTEWNTLDFLVGTATGSLSAEIVAGTAPSGELGGTWASPTVDATHSGSAHHSAVTVSGTPDYITLSGQDIVRAKLDISDDTNATGGVGVDITTNDFTFDATELTNLTWSAGGSALLTHTFNLSGTDPVMTFGNNYVSVSTGNLGVGNTAPQALLDVGTSPGVGLIVLNTGSVGIGTTAPAQKLDIIGTIRTTDTLPLMRLNVLSVVAGTIPGGHLHITKSYVLDRLRAWITGGTNVIFTVKGSVFPGTGPYYNLTVGQTAVPGGLTVTSFTGGTVPGGHLVITDIVSVSGTIPGMGLIIDGHEQ